MLVCHFQGPTCITAPSIDLHRFVRPHYIRIVDYIEHIHTSNSLYIYIYICIHHLINILNSCYTMHLLNQCQDNVTVLDIRSWCQRPGLPVGQHYNQEVAISEHCHKSVLVMMTLDGARTMNSNKQQRSYAICSKTFLESPDREMYLHMVNLGRWSIWGFRISLFLYFMSDRLVPKWNRYRKQLNCGGGQLERFYYNSFP